MRVHTDVQVPENAAVTLSNGKTLPVRFMVTAEVDASYDASCDTPDIMEQIISGQIMPAYLEVSACVPGLSAEGSADLGGCLISTKSDIEEILSEHSMFDEALANLKNVLEVELKVLQP